MGKELSDLSDDKFNISPVLLIYRRIIGHPNHLGGAQSHRYICSETEIRLCQSLFHQVSQPRLKKWWLASLQSFNNSIIKVQRNHLVSSRRETCSGNRT